MQVSRRIISTFSQGFVEYLFVLPLIFIIGYFTINQDWWVWLISLLVLLFVGVTYRTLLPNQKWWMYFFVALVLGILPSFIFVEQWIFVGILSVIQIIFIYRGMMHVDQSKNTRLPIPYLWIGGFGIYVVSYFVFRFVDTLSPYLSFITVAGVVFVSITMFLSNSDRLKSATLSKQRNPAVSREVKGKNSLFLGITILLIILVANAHMIRDGFLNVVSTIVQSIFGDSPDPSQEGVGDEPPPSSSVDAPGGLPEGEPSTVAKALETIIMYSMYVLLIVGAVLLLLFIFKQTRKHVLNIFNTVINFLKQMVTPTTNNEATEAYVDEKENIFNWEEWKETQQGKMKKVFDYFKREPSFKSLSNQEKIRYIYRELFLQRKKDIDYKISNTPRENLQAITASSTIDKEKVKKLQIAYERMRYGDKEIDEDIIEEIRLLLSE